MLSNVNNRIGKPSERQDAGDGDRLHRRDPPPPHQHPEDGKETPGGNKQQIAANPVRAYGPERFGADHSQADDNDECADDAARRQRLLQDDARQDHAAQRRAGRLNDAAMTERNKQITEVAQKRERQPAKHRKRETVTPPDAPRSRHPVLATKGRSISPGQTKRCSARTRGDKPTSMPWRAATKPSAQDKAAPAPQATPSAFACFTDGGASSIQVR